MTTAQAQQLIYSDDDFIYSKRYEYSLTKLLERYPEGCPDRIVAAVLMVTEDDVASAYNDIVVKLRYVIGVDDDSL